MKLLILKLWQRLFGYCVRHNRYGRPCIGCQVEERLKNPVTFGGGQ